MSSEQRGFDDVVKELEQAHGADHEWVSFLHMSKDSPGEFSEIFKDEYYSFEDSMPKVEELADMVQTHLPPHRVEGDLSLDEPLIVLGDLDVAGRLYTSSVLIVLGNMKAKVMADCGPDSLIVVQGNVKTSVLWTDGEFHVAGDIQATEIVYGAYNDNVLVGTRIVAPVVVQDDHSMEGEIEAEHHIAYESQAPLAKLFIEGGFNTEKNKLDMSFLCDKVLAGEPIRVKA